MEEELILKLRNKKTQSEGFKELVELFAKRVYFHNRKMVLNHEDADDITQEVFVKIWKNIEKFRGDSSLFTWIYRIATNECLSHLKKKKRLGIFSLQSEEFDNSASMVADNISPTADVIQQKLQSAINELPAKQKQVFVLKYYEELKFKEISEITSTSVGALKATYHHAVKKIEKRITE